MRKRTRPLALLEFKLLNLFMGSVKGARANTTDQTIYIYNSDSKRSWRKRPAGASLI
jgi:hypothetical protein